MTKKWPIQGDPGREAWSIWKKFLSRAFKTTSGRLQATLGKWTQRNTTREHNAYWSPSLKALLLPDGRNRWNHHKLINAGRRQNYFNKKSDQSSNLHDDAVPADVSAETGKHYITGTLAEWHKTFIPQPNTFNEKLARQHNNTLFSTIELLVKEESLEDFFLKQALIDTATDGGHDPNSGSLTYGWVIAMNENIIAKGRGPAEAHPTMSESFRAEAYGLASATAFICLLIQHFQITASDHRWFFHIDSKTLIQRMESYLTQHNPQMVTQTGYRHHQSSQPESEWSQCSNPTHQGASRQAQNHQTTIISGSTKCNGRRTSKTTATSHDVTQNKSNHRPSSPNNRRHVHHTRQPAMDIG